MSSAPVASLSMSYAADESFQADDLIALFKQQFEVSEQTLLVRGDDEPIYLPKNPTQACHHVIFAHGFFASAMHELAHWCIAGPQRRQLVDYGYWYEPDGRTVAQQMAFAKVEAKPQALEWIFNKACGRKFYISLDNLNANPGETLPFKQAVFAEIEHYRTMGLPKRALQWQQALAQFYGQPNDWLTYAFSLQELD